MRIRSTTLITKNTINPDQAIRTKNIDHPLNSTKNKRKTMRAICQTKKKISEAFNFLWRGSGRSAWLFAPLLFFLGWALISALVFRNEEYASNAALIACSIGVIAAIDMISKSFISFMETEASIWRLMGKSAETRREIGNILSQNVKGVAPLPAGADVETELKQ